LLTIKYKATKKTPKATKNLKKIAIVKLLLKI